MERVGGEVFTLGDNAYVTGRVAEYRSCWGPTWGRFDDRVHPSPGNHDYLDPDVGYFDWFGARAGPRGAGYYSYDRGGWRILSMNSEANIAAQVRWVAGAVGGRDCVLAYWHRPFRSSGPYGSDPAMAPLWQAAYDAGVDLVLNSHQHSYERFARLGRTGSPDRRGMRELIVGTGGRSLYSFGAVAPGSEVRSAASYGVVELTLGDGTYGWRFHSTNGAFTDRGSDTCR